MSDTFEANQPSETKVIPHSREAEDAVIGSILINPMTYYDVAAFLKVEDFFIRRNGWIWETFQRLHERSIPIDILTVSEELDAQGRLNEAGGIPYLSTLANNIPTSLHAEAYGRIVEETSIRRRMLEAANQIARLAYNEGTSLEAAMDDAAKAVFGVSEDRVRSDLQPISDVIKDYNTHLAMLAARSDEIFGVPTGFTDLDRILIGLQPSDFILIAGRPGQGKTGFLITVAKNAAQKFQKHVAIFSLEMSNDQLVQRLVAQETGIDSQRLRTGKLDDDEWDLFYAACDSLTTTRIFLDDTPAITPLQLRTKCRRLHLEYRLDLIIVDYLQLMSSGRRIDNRVQEVSEISRYLKVLARELNVPVLAAAQLSRAVEQRADKTPVLSDLRESGSLEQDADVVMFIYRPDQYEKEAMPNVAKIIVAKHRNGPTGNVELIFLSRLAKFENAATKYVNLAELR
jgi:replicative DNA helicase